MAELISFVTASFGALEKGLDFLSKKSESDPDIASHVLSLQKSLRDMHDAWSSVSAENEALKAKITEYDRWEDSFADYEKRRVKGGAVVFVHKDNDWDLICPNCVQQKSLQQLQDMKNMTGDFSCPNCRATFPVGPDEHEQYYGETMG